MAHDPIRRNERDDVLDVTPGSPVDWVRWGPILGGVFAALTALTVLTTLGTAIGLSAYDPGDDTRRFAIGAGMWGIISMLLSFGLGGLIASRTAAVHGRDYGLLHGFLVAAVGIPTLMFLLSSGAALMGYAAVSNRDAPTVQQTSAQRSTTTGDATAAGAAAATTDREASRNAARRGAWGTLLALLLSIGAATVGGYKGAHDGTDHRRADRRPGATDMPGGVPVAR